MFKKANGHLEEVAYNLKAKEKRYSERWGERTQVLDYQEKRYDRGGGQLDPEVEQTLLAESNHVQEEDGETREQGRLGTLNANLLNPKIYRHR